MEGLVVLSHEEHEIQMITLGEKLYSENKFLEAIELYTELIKLQNIIYNINKEKPFSLQSYHTIMEPIMQTTICIAKCKESLDDIQGAIDIIEYNKTTYFESYLRFSKSLHPIVRYLIDLRKKTPTQIAYNLFDTSIQSMYGVKCPRLVTRLYNFNPHFIVKDMTLPELLDRLESTYKHLGVICRHEDRHYEYENTYNAFYNSERISLVISIETIVLNSEAINFGFMVQISRYGGCREACCAIAYTIAEKAGIYINSHINILEHEELNKLSQTAINIFQETLKELDKTESWSTHGFKFMLEIIDNSPIDFFTTDIGLELLQLIIKLCHYDYMQIYPLSIIVLIVRKTKSFSHLILSELDNVIRLCEKNTCEFVIHETMQLKKIINK